MRIVRILLVAVFALLSAGTASAQDRGLAERTVLAERYIRLSMGDDLRPMVESVIEEQLAASGDLTPEQRSWFRANVPVFFDAFMNRLIDLLAPRYAASMTEEELAAGIAFYSSPLGRSLARKQVALQIGMEEDVYEAAESMSAEIDAKYCAAFDCEGTPFVASSGK
jgi:hypothetical protein